MLARFTEFLENQFNIPQARSQLFLQRLLVALAASIFVLCGTVIIAFDAIFVTFNNNVSTLEADSRAPTDINAPTDMTFISQVLTDEARDKARRDTDIVYYAPAPEISQQQTDIARQILTYIDNVRRDPYGTDEQKIADLDAINTINLEPRIAELMIKFDDETWTAIQSEVIRLLPFVMSQTIREGQSQIQAIRSQLPVQVNVNFDAQPRAAVVDIIDDLILPNTFENVQETELARDRAAETITGIPRTFVSGTPIVIEGQTISAADYEALQILGVLKTDNLRTQEILQGFLASVLILVVGGLYIARFSSRYLYQSPQMLLLVATIFLITLFALQALNQYLYLFPAAAMALLLLTITDAHIALITGLALALGGGIIAGTSLEITTLIAAGSITGVIMLRRAERLNSFFATGAIIAVINIAVVGIFNLVSPSILNGSTATDIFGTFLMVGINGILLVPAAAITVMYAVSLAFNLPTTLKLLDLSQPAKPLLQRLLREAPGTYQHSLQVGNLAEQAASAIGADAALTQVAALYHDIGKMLNPVYFTENQQNIGNPHDALNDPHRSADIIIGHIRDGDELAKQYRLPNRIRDFIREHHGTTQVYVFYQRALKEADGDESAIDINDFTYPGPVPRSKETAILMLADSCEAAVRSINPKSKQEISNLVSKIIDDKHRQGQLSQSGLTLNDLDDIRNIFVDILQGMFHPRINYQDAVDKPATQPKKPANSITARPTPPPIPGTMRSPQEKSSVEQNGTMPQKVKTAERPPVKTAPVNELEDDEPMTEVPRLPRTNTQMKRPDTAATAHNGTARASTTDPETEEKVNED